MVFSTNDAIRKLVADQRIALCCVAYEATFCTLAESSAILFKIHETENSSTN